MSAKLAKDYDEVISISSNLVTHEELDKHGQKVIRRVPLCTVHLFGEKDENTMAALSTRDFFEINMQSSHLELFLSNDITGEALDEDIWVTVHVLYRRKA